jgi:hypothetical protein
VDEIARSSAEFALSNAAIISFSKGKRGFFLEFDGKSIETLGEQGHCSDISVEEI